MITKYVHATYIDTENENYYGLLNAPMNENLRLAQRKTLILYICKRLYLKGGDFMEKVYDARRRLRGYVDNNTIYDSDNNIMGYTDGYMLYDQYGTPLAYVDEGYVRTMGGTPVGYYRDTRLYDMSGNYLGYGNFGFFGLLGASFLLLLLGGLFWPRWYW